MSLAAPPTEGRSILQHFHLVFEDELVSRNLVDEVANLLGDERADAEDRRTAGVLGARSSAITARRVQGRTIR